MDYQRLLETTEEILILRGGPTSGNWGHSGRKGKRGGAGRGGRSMRYIETGVLNDGRAAEIKSLLAPPRHNGGSRSGEVLKFDQTPFDPKVIY